MGLLDGMLGGVMKEVLGDGQSKPEGGAEHGIVAALLPIVMEMLADRGTTTRAAAGSAGPLGNIIGAVLGGAGSSAGGLGDLLGHIRKLGFEREADSWVDSGANLPISADAVRKIFGAEALTRIAEQAGLGETETAHGLSQVLPEVVNTLTPDGRMPELDQLSAGVDSLRQKLGL